MRRSSAVLLLLTVVGGVGGAALAREHEDDQTRLAKALAGYTAGQPTSCIDPAFPDLQTHVFGKTILYQNGGGQIWRTETTGGCEAAEHGDVLVQVEHEGRPCSGDIIRTLDQYTHIPNGSCALGQFVPYTRPRR